MESDTSAVLAECRIRLGEFVEAEQDIRRALMIRAIQAGIRACSCRNSSRPGKAFQRHPQRRKPNLSVTLRIVSSRPG